MGLPSCLLRPSTVLIVASWFFGTHAYNYNSNYFCSMSGSTTSRGCFHSNSGCSSSRTLFFGRPIDSTRTTTTMTLEKSYNNPNNSHFGGDGRITLSRGMWITMRKQKASDRRTRRKQRGEASYVLTVVENAAALSTTTTTSSESKQLQKQQKKSLVTNTPMKNAIWNHKHIHHPSTTTTEIPSSLSSTNLRDNSSAVSGRGRSRKRTLLYQTLAQYQNHFVQLLSADYQVEEEEILGRIDASLEDPIGFERAGYCWLDMMAQRRGTLFGSEDVYRFSKAPDATTTIHPSSTDTQRRQRHKFGPNDVIILTQQIQGSGDFFTLASLPTSELANILEARVLNVGGDPANPHLDVAIPAGRFQAAFGQDEQRLERFRIDRYVSPVSYLRMVAALSQITAIPSLNTLPSQQHHKKKKDYRDEDDDDDDNEKTVPEIHMDPVLKEVILSTFFLPQQPPDQSPVSDAVLDDLARKIAKPPMATSSQLANRMLQYMQSSSSKVNIFRAFNASQLRALEAAWTRRLTLIQGPPGSGKTAVAAAAAFGFAYQCRNAISKKSAKVLATAFSNTGADNLARAMIEVGLRVIRIGKPSAVDQLLWEHTLEAAIDRDPAAQKALQAAAKATAQLSKLNQRNDNSNRASGKATTTNIRDRAIRDAATDAVKAAIEAANLAATKALRETDVIVSTSTGAADPRLLRACGIKSAEDPNDDEKEQNTKTKSGMNDRVMAPDGLPPLSLPFVIIDEACQSVEPATLIPILASNSCRSLVLLGDPCQLPPTVLSRQASKELSVSLMERLAEILPQPVTSNQNDSVVKIDESYLGALPMKQAISLLRSRSSSTEKHRTYRKTYGGSILLSTQYRMHPSIAAFSSAIFYDGLLSTPDFMTHRRLFPNALQRSMPHEDPKLCVRFVDIGGQENERQGMPSSKYTPSAYNSKSSTSSFLFQQQQQSTSFWNEVEAAKVIEIVKDVLSDEDDNVKSIGIISPYNGQVQLIQLLIANDDQLKDLLSQRKTSFSDISIEVNSVDGYQGRERDMVIFSAVRSNRRGQIGFLRDWRRLNVAITRAKSALVIVGDVATLTAANDPYWEALVKWASGSRCIVTADDKKQ